MTRDIVFLHEITDNQIAYLYSNALCLCFTSEFEGNFPTQIYEALYYRTPIVTNEMELIEEKLGDLSSGLLKSRRNNIEDFVGNINKIEHNRELIIENQEVLRAFLMKESSNKQFIEGVQNLFVN